ncbi:winged helix-turn-helix domain-containing protein [Yersinia ruckeri]|uniref:winged helix-turn-helix domain-containing protein n=2 Tax=Yersinia ruckeri TaxID=29486 RepID=UPI0004E42037|nr:helix-turn-helix domain-containing protein [Yersinia ruckeri]ARZ00587.1 hypothetical protein QMA0440_01243 [Yersinia ruckeri]AUQ42713.1 winged helix family transcriptional regulator [Yersinia ruckeri]EKN4199143.1 winged helix-turn-helix domain-containing protein [Yersinia ruckeri]EKN4205602.1 winged helix-turn-helix domain-containing protein [Yersinia ruckeri]EKN4689665.1 winged helix-turn-helix domain-containing protein [Yersinia ruckeri]
MKDQIIDVSYFERGVITIHNNKLKIKNTDAEVTLSKNQRKLLVCLMKNINEKERIIELIWGDSGIREMSYHQLIYKTRFRLSNNGFPDEFIMTIPRYGLCLNKAFVGHTLRKQECGTANEFLLPGISVCDSP